VIRLKGYFKHDEYIGEAIATPNERKISSSYNIMSSSPCNKRKDLKKRKVTVSPFTSNSLIHLTVVEKDEDQIDGLSKMPHIETRSTVRSFDGIQTSSKENEAIRQRKHRQSVHMMRAKYNIQDKRQTGKT